MRFGFFLCGVLACTPVLAQDAKKEIQKYQQMIAEGSPTSR
jgi:hypothetical protein